MTATLTMGAMSVSVPLLFDLISDLMFWRWSFELPYRDRVETRDKIVAPVACTSCKANAR